MIVFSHYNLESYSISVILWHGKFYKGKALPNIIRVQENLKTKGTASRYSTNSKAMFRSSSV